MAGTQFALGPGMVVPSSRPIDRVTAVDDTFSNDRMVWLGPRTLGVWLTHEESFRLSAVWACVNVIAKAIASCSWPVFTQDDKGNREPQPTMRTWQLLNVRPNPECTPFSFREAQLLLALTHGNSYAEIERDVMNRPLRLWPLATDRCQLMRDAVTKRLGVMVSGNAGGDVWLDYDDVYHLHGPGIDGVSGFDVVSVAARSLAQMVATERTGGSFYQNGMQLSGVLTSQRPLSDDRITSMRKEIERRHQGQAGGFLILSGGMTWTQLSATPKDAQLAETQKALLLDACRWWGVPPHKIAELTGATLTNIEQLALEFVRDGLTPWCERLAQEADWKLLPSIGNYKTRIETDWLAEGDSAARANSDSTRVNNGLLTRNEARRARGLNSAGPEGDKLTVNGNLITLKEAVSRKAAPASTTTPQPGQNVDQNGDPTPTTQDGQMMPDATQTGGKGSGNGTASTNGVAH